MKTLIIIVILVTIGFGAWFFLKDSATAPVNGDDLGPREEVVLTDGSYAIDTDSSNLAWRGSRPLIPGYFDNGIVAIQGGSLEVTDGVISGGSFTIDMTSITALSTGRGEDEDRLTGHLKSADFFDVENFPTSTFTITDATADGMVTGNLTIKGTTHPVTLPVALTEENGALRAQGSVELDRTNWDVRYGSGSFFQDLGNNLISDNFTIALDLTATMAQ